VGVPNLERALEVAGTTLSQNKKPGDVKAEGVRHRRCRTTCGGVGHHQVWAARGACPARDPLSFASQTV